MARRSTTPWEERSHSHANKTFDLFVLIHQTATTVHLWVSEWTSMRVYVVDVTPVCCCLSAVHRIDSWTLTAPVSKSSPSACENWVTWISSPLKSEIVDSLVNSWRVSSCLSLISFFFSPRRNYLFKFFPVEYLRLYAALVVSACLFFITQNMPSQQVWSIFGEETV